MRALESLGRVAAVTSCAHSGQGQENRLGGSMQRLLYLRKGFTLLSISSTSEMPPPGEPASVAPRVDPMVAARVRLPKVPMVLAALIHVEAGEGGGSLDPLAVLPLIDGATLAALIHDDAAD